MTTHAAGATSGGHVASKDKGGKSEKKQPKKNLKEKRAEKKQKKAKPSTL